MSTCVGLVSMAPEKNGIQQQGGWRMQQIMAGDPQWIVEVQIVKCVVHHSRYWLGGNMAVVKKIPNRQ